VWNQGRAWAASTATQQWRPPQANAGHSWSQPSEARPTDAGRYGFSDSDVKPDAKPVQALGTDGRPIIFQ
jgi:hypothetical protein